MENFVELCEKFGLEGESYLSLCVKKREKRRNVGS